MMARKFTGMAMAAALALAACSRAPDNVLQGWIEADLIFVSPDEQGRVETLQVREGDRIQSGSLLVTVDSDLQKSDLGVAEASYRNASQAFERAQTLLKSGSGTQSAFDIAQAVYREAEARLNAAKTRVERRTLWSPVTGVVQQVYFRPGETVPAGKQARSTSKEETPSRSSPTTSETRWDTCEKRSTSMVRATCTLPARHTRERSLRPRSTSITCSARSFSDESSRSASPSVGSVVPAMGQRLARPSSHATSRSGDDPTSDIPSSSSRNRYGDGLTRRRARYTSSGVADVGRSARCDGTHWKTSPATMCSLTERTIAS